MNLLCLVLVKIPILEDLLGNSFSMTGLGHMEVQNFKIQATPTQESDRII